MQISKKRELSRKSELKEYSGDGYCCQNLKFLLGQFVAGVLGTVVGGRGCWNEMSR